MPPNGLDVIASGVITCSTNQFIADEQNDGPLALTKIETHWHYSFDLHVKRP